MGTETSMDGGKEEKSGLIRTVTAIQLSTAAAVEVELSSQFWVMQKPRVYKVYSSKKGIARTKLSSHRLLLLQDL